MFIIVCLLFALYFIAACLSTIFGFRIIPHWIETIGTWMFFAAAAYGIIAFIANFIRKARDNSQQHKKPE